MDSPNVPKKEITTDAISTSGATSAWSRIARITAISKSASGTMILMSRRDASA